MTGAVGNSAAILSQSSERTKKKGAHEGSGCRAASPGASAAFPASHRADTGRLFRLGCIDRVRSGAAQVRRRTRLESATVRRTKTLRQLLRPLSPALFH